MQSLALTLRRKIIRFHKDHPSFPIKQRLKLIKWKKVKVMSMDLLVILAEKVKINMKIIITKKAKDSSGS